MIVEKKTVKDYEERISCWKLHIESDLSNFGKGFMCLFVVTIPFIVSTVTDKKVEDVAEKWRVAKYSIDWHEKSIERHSEKTKKTREIWLI